MEIQEEEDGEEDEEILEYN